MPNTEATPTPAAYSYIRFSHPDQARGDSLRRQTEAADRWCVAHGVRLDTATTFRDLGRSAFRGGHRHNPDRNALAAFLKLVEDGRVPPGSYLLIENLDRLSREDTVPATHLLTGILMAGVRVVQLSPAELLLTDKSDPFDVMRAVMELSRGNSESKVKSERVGAAWEEKRRRVRDGECQKATERMGEGCKFLTRRLPAWITERDGELVAIPERAAIIRRIFAMAAGGYGTHAIVAKLNAEGVPAFAHAGVWVRSYVGYILTDRRAVGEFRQKRRPRKLAETDFIAGYYPAVVTEEEWAAARAGAAQRRLMPGATGTHVNVFAGLLRNARDGDSYYSSTRSHQNPGKERTRWRVLLNTSSEGRGGTAWTFRAEPFERAVLSLLKEIDPREVLGNQGGEADEAQALAADLARVEGSIGLVAAELDEHGESQTLFRRLRDKEAEKRRLVEQLAEARQRAANPLSEAWGECKTLLAALDAAPDEHEARLRLRSALRRIVDSIWLLVIPRGWERMCAVQVWFAGGERRRDYLIWHRPYHAPSKRAEAWWARSLSDVAGPGKLDLRDPAHAADLAKALESIDPAALDNDRPCPRRRRKKKQ